MSLKRKKWVILSAQLLGLALLLTGGFMLMSGGAFTPTTALLVGDGPRIPERENPFSLLSLRERLPERGLRHVQSLVNYYQSKNKRGFEASLARSGRYIDTIKGIFHAEGLPEELAYLPIIESGFNEHAVSSAKAVGMWQFMDATGRRFDLHRTEFVDNKRDPIQSTRAAAKYLKTLYKIFHNWELALAAYNAGEGTVLWAMKNNRKEGKPVDYWSLDLPAETQGYVPSFLAAVIIAKNPPAFNFTKVPFHSKLAFDVIDAPPGATLENLATRMNVDLEDLMELNPQLLTGQVPPGNKAYKLRVPKGAKPLGGLMTGLLGTIQIS